MSENLIDALKCKCKAVACSVGSMQKFQIDMAA